MSRLVVMSPFGWLVGSAVVAILTTTVRADELLLGYEGDVHPSEVASGSNPCEPPTCLDSVQAGHYIVVWPNGGDRFIHQFDITRSPTPPPPTLWVEWRFRSNRPISPYCFSSDGQLRVVYDHIGETVNMYGDTTIDQSGDFAVTGHPLNEFRSYRFESVDGRLYRFSVDGYVFKERSDTANNVVTTVAIYGQGGCATDSIPDAENTWDFVRYGLITSGERLVASDPPSGFVDPQQHPGFDRFAVTFDQPCYVYIEDVAVEVTGGGAAPQVIQTRRLNNGPPDTVEIVLDAPLPIGETTTFTFDTGLEPPDENVLSYTLAPPPIGPCCDEATGVCTDDVALPDCENAGARFGGEASTCITIEPPCLPPPPTGACCDDAAGVCSEDLTQTDCESTARRYSGDDSDCASIDPPCLPPPPTGACCDDDTGICTDDVIHADCQTGARRYGGDVSACSTIDPPCSSAEPAIPAASTWGVVVFALILLVAGKVVFGRSAAQSA